MESEGGAARSGSSPPWGDTVLVEFDEGIAWVTLNRPDKRNAMNPRLNEEMVATLDALEGDDRCRVVVLTGAGEAWSAGMDLQEYFRDVDAAGDPALQDRVRRTAAEWQWRRLSTYPKPTVAMVNGWCFGGAFTPLVACDLAVAAEDARFGLSEINWGIPPGGVVSRALAAVVPQRDALYHIMTGEAFDGRAAARMRLVNEAVPAERLHDRTRELALRLAGMNPVVLRAAKTGYKVAAEMPWDRAEDYLYAKLEQSQFLDPEQGRSRGLEQFLDAKSYRPGLGHYARG
ncbi:p-hydroxycinnamoyl CoA hydratase/lyase [Streptomonospora sp. PA3]|uniref:p-hydroxycinnamoyl CoA hydratase/lyase n=1 Tax=Streptomonospora sp. PA3 TaxID=2607326 RepID=UPI0012DC1700|nr:p-hydroxycinnamoyl CoA hydratase/lyase [Streptomonospora sp. PA3]MUL40048.1 p-hydroxycinnamoyl CoA hydratase/lyase [Streptomonospora sp. PA3]